MEAAPVPREFVTALTPALRQAAAIARALEGRVRNRPKAGEARAAKAALTIADTATQEALLVPLLERFPQVGLEAEEDTPSARRFARSGDGHVVVDPIDGTLHSYLDGDGPYAVMLGLAVGGRYEAALLALPREGIFLDAVRGEGARAARAGGSPRPVRARAQGDGVLVSHELPQPVRERLAERGYRVESASGGAIAVAPLLPGVRAGLRLATDTGSISRRGRIGVLIASEAGAAVRAEGGGGFPVNLDTPAKALLVAASDADLANLEYALAAAT